jgi:small-conductance mechanosensitive channel
LIARLHGRRPEAGLLLEWPRWISQHALRWEDVALAFGVATTVFVVLWTARLFVRRKHKAYAATEAREALELPALAFSRTTAPFLVIMAAYAGLEGFDLAPRTAAVVRSVAMIALFWQAGLWASTAAMAWLHHRAADTARNGKALAGSLGILRFLTQVVIWAMVVLLTLENVGVDITALVAGLGIGGVAVALALQNVLGDLLASLSITLDQPFVVGDFIATGEYLGSVEYVGIKSTRLRSLSGEQIVMPNSDLLSNPVRNYGRMAQRRVAFKLGVEYETPRDRLEQVAPAVRRIIEAQDDVRFDRCHFSAFAESALEFEAVYYVLSADYNRYMDIQQSIYFAIHAELERLGIGFAYPVRRVFWANPPGPADRSV